MGNQKTPQWYFQINGIEEGPITSQTLRSLAAKGRIRSDTPIRKEGMTRTVPANKIKGLLNTNEQAHVINSEVIPHEIAKPATEPKFSGKISHVRPWVRFWARIFDISLFTALVFIFVGYPTQGDLQSFSITIPFIWVFIEAALLRTLGTTPGKFLFRTQLILASSSKFSYSQALKRSLKVWWRGTGAWIPIVSIVTLIVAHNRLIKNQKTSWDREGDFIIDHEKIGLLRVLLAIALFIIIYFAPVIMLRSFYF